MRMKRGTNRGGVGKRLICSESDLSLNGRNHRFVKVVDQRRLLRSAFPRMKIIHAMYKKVSLGFALFSAELKQWSVRKHAAIQHPLDDFGMTSCYYCLPDGRDHG
jgi:hypothetical protein